MFGIDDLICGLRELSGRELRELSDERLWQFEANCHHWSQMALAEMAARQADRSGALVPETAPPGLPDHTAEDQTTDQTAVTR